MSDSFLPPVTVEFNANVTSGLAGIDRLIKGLAGITDAARAAAESVDAAFASMSSGVEVLTAVTDAAKAARTQISGIATAAKRVATASEAASTATDSAFTAIGAGADTMAAAVDASATRASEGLATMDEAARTAGLGVTSMGEEIVASMQAAATEMHAAATEMRTSLAGVAASARTTAEETGAAEESMGAKFLGLGEITSKLKAIVPLSLAAIGYESVKMASTFQKSTTQLVTSAGESASKIDMVRSGLLNLAGQVGVSADGLAKALYYVDAAGYHAADGLVVLKAAAQGAAAEGADTTTVAKALTDILVDYHLKASAAADVTSKMITAVAHGKTNLQEFSGAFASIVPAASAAGISFQDVMAALAQMTNHGFTAARASQNLAQALRSMLNPTNVMARAWQEYGVSSATVREKLAGPNGLTDAMQYLSQMALKAGKEGTPAFAAALKMLMGTAPGANAALATVGANFSATSDTIKAVGGATADASGKVEGFALVQQNLSWQLKSLRAGFDSVMIRIGDGLIPILSRLITLVESRATPVIHALGAALSGIAAGFSAPADAVDKLLNAVSHPTVGPVVPKPGSFTQNLGRFNPFLPNGPTSGMLLPTPAPIPTIGPATGRGPVASLTQNLGSPAPTSLLQTKQGGFNPFLPNGPTAGMKESLPAPKMTGWEKVGQTLAAVAADLKTFGADAAKAFDLLMKAAGPTLTLLGTVGLAALKMIAQILANVVGPALVKVTGFMNQHKGAVRDLIAVALIPLALRLAALSIIKPIGALVGLTKSIVTFPFSQASKIATSTKTMWGSLFGAAETTDAEGKTVAAVQGFFPKMAGIFSTGFASIKTGWGKLFGVAEATDAEGNVTPAVQGFFSKVGGAFSAGWGALSRGASTFWSGLGRGASAAAGGLSRAWGGITTGASAVGGALKTAGQSALTFASNAGSAIASMASSAWSSAVAGAQAIATSLAAAAAAAWDFAVKAALATAAALKQAAGFVIDQVATAAEAVATIAETVATTVGTAALTAFDIVLAIATSPITLIIAAILGLVAAIVWIAVKTTWFQTAWTYTWNAIKAAALAVWHSLDSDVIQPIATAFSWLWTNAIAPALRFIVGGFLNMAGTILHAAASMLGWVPGIGGTLKTASKGFDSFKNSVMASLGGATGAANGLSNAVNNIPRLVTITFNGVNQGTLAGHTYTSTTGQSYAEGGIRPAASGLMNQAGMARAGSNILWAEKATGGESFIPHALSKRPRSRAIAEKTVGILGGAVAWGGTGSPAPLRSGGSGPSPAYGGGGTTVVYNVNVNVAGTVTSERNLRDTIQSQLLQLGARNSQTYQQYKR